MSIWCSPPLTQLTLINVIADKTVEVATPPISAVTYSTSKFDQLCAEIADLKCIIESLCINNDQQSSTCGCTPCSSQAQTPTTIDNPDKICWYH